MLFCEIVTQRVVIDRPEHRLEFLKSCFNTCDYGPGVDSAPCDYGPGVDSASNRNEYQEYFLGVKAASA